MTPDEFISVNWIRIVTSILTEVNCKSCLVHRRVIMQSTSCLTNNVWLTKRLIDVTPSPWPPSSSVRSTVCFSLRSKFTNIRWFLSVTQWKYLPCQQITQLAHKFAKKNIFFLFTSTEINQNNGSLEEGDERLSDYWPMESFLHLT